MQVQTDVLHDKYSHLKYLKANIYSFVLQMNSSDQHSSDDVKGTTSKEMVNIQ